MRNAEGSYFRRMEEGLRRKGNAGKRQPTGAGTFWGGGAKRKASEDLKIRHTVSPWENGKGGISVEIGEKRVNKRKVRLNFWLWLTLQMG